MLIVRDSQVKKLFYKEQEIDKILDWKGNVVFEKESAPVMTNTVKFHTTSSVSSTNRFTVRFTDSTTAVTNYSEKDTWYTMEIPTDKTVKSIESDNTYIDELDISCKVSLSTNLISGKPKIAKFISCDATSNTSLSDAFTYVASESVEVRNLDARNATDINSLCYNAKSLETIVLRDLNVSKATNMQSMFRYCSGATTIDVANWDTSSATDINHAFANCGNLASLDLSSWNISNVTDMSHLCYGCHNLTSVNMSRLNAKKVAKMTNMFYGCNNLTSVNMSGFETSEVYDASYLFSNCYHLQSLDLSSFITTSLENLKYTFYYCSKLTDLDISGWDLSNLFYSTSDTFTGCGALKTIYMRGCNQKTIDKIKSALTSAGILNNVTIVTE